MIGQVLAGMFVLAIGFSFLNDVNIGVEKARSETGYYERETNARTLPRGTIGAVTPPKPIAAPMVTATASIAPRGAALTDDALRSGYEDALRIVNAAGMYGVPENALYAHWNKESHLLAEGWREGSERWIPARELLSPTGKCAKAYGAESCAMRYERIRYICTKQSRQVCDPETVRVTYGGAMGPLQHMPQWTVLKQPDGSMRWAPCAVDFDHDGVVNPLDLDDALANAACQLRTSHDKAVKRGERDPWREAMLRYAGKTKDGWKHQYVDGHTVNGTFVPGTRHFWARWAACRAQGTCPTEIARSRTR